MHNIFFFLSLLTPPQPKPQCSFVMSQLERKRVERLDKFRKFLKDTAKEVKAK